jgi:hypothetical protein
MYNYKPLILCSFKDFSAENISFKIDRIERFQKVLGVGKPKTSFKTLFSRKYFV